jgi:hypothetical protein
MASSRVMVWSYRRGCSSLAVLLHCFIAIFHEHSTCPSLNQLALPPRACLLARASIRQCSYQSTLWTRVFSKSHTLLDLISVVRRPRLSINIVPRVGLGPFSKTAFDGCCFYISLSCSCCCNGLHPCPWSTDAHGDGFCYHSAVPPYSMRSAAEADNLAEGSTFIRHNSIVVQAVSTAAFMCTSTPHLHVICARRNVCDDVNGSAAAIPLYTKPARVW